MRVSYHPDYVVELPPRHPFPMRKFSATFQILRDEQLIAANDVMTPEEIPLDTLRSAHSESYIRKLATGTLDDQEVRRIGVPWSAKLWRRSRLAVHGTLLAARAALADGLAANISGGTHHAMPDHGEGFCVLNDVAVVVRLLRDEHPGIRCLVLDLDVHQGNGNAHAFRNDALTFTCSMHGEKNYPVRKPPSDCDIGLQDGVGDDVYLATLERHLPRLFDAARPDLVLYLAGVDVVQGDRYGRLALTRQGLHERERLVLEALHRFGTPGAILMSGGYASTPEATADLHAIVHREAARHVGDDASASEDATPLVAD